MSTPTIEFSRVTLIFDDVVALENVSFRVDTGSSLVILGVAGSGKSVLLKLSLGLLKPDGGEIYLFGERINNLPEQDLAPLRQQMGMVFQESALFDSFTVAENVAYPLVNQETKTPPPEEVETRDRKSTRLNSSHIQKSRMPSSA